MDKIFILKNSLVNGDFFLFWLFLKKMVKKRLIFFEKGLKNSELFKPNFFLS